jgi:hypothetical protein
MAGTERVLVRVASFKAPHHVGGEFLPLLAFSGGRASELAVVRSDPGTDRAAAHDRIERGEQGGLH